MTAHIPLLADHKDAVGRLCNLGFRLQRANAALREFLGMVTGTTPARAAFELRGDRPRHFSDVTMTVSFTSPEGADPAAWSRSVVSLLPSGLRVEAERRLGRTTHLVLAPDGASGAYFVTMVCDLADGLYMRKIRDKKA
jgi:hypothetical protein